MGISMKITSNYWIMQKPDVVTSQHIPIAYPDHPRPKKCYGNYVRWYFPITNILQ